MTTTRTATPRRATSPTARTAATVTGAGPDPAGDFTVTGEPNRPVEGRTLQLLADRPAARLWRHLPTGYLGLTFTTSSAHQLVALGGFLEVAPTVWTH